MSERDKLPPGRHYDDVAPGSPISLEEPVARAICCGGTPCAAKFDGSEFTICQAHTYMRAARAAIAAVREHAPDPAEARNEWRETVRDIYDNLHFAKWEGLPAKLVAMIEKRHPDYFADAEHITPETARRIGDALAALQGNGEVGKP